MPRTSRSMSVLLGLAMLLPPALAGANDCRSLTVETPPYVGNSRVISKTVAGNPVKILLPVGYRNSGRRYPVLYLLHGFSMNQDSWLVFSDIVDFTKSFQGRDAAIVVMPFENGLGFDIDHRNGTWTWETFTITQLIPYIDAHFRTLPDRAHRAVAGLSGGGSTTMILAARHPDMFAAAGGFSGVYDYTAGSPLGETGFYALADRTLWACSGGQVGDEGVVGDPVQDDIWWHAIDPVELARNFRGVNAYIVAGDGTPCDELDIMGLAEQRTPAAMVYQFGDAGFRPGAQALDTALTGAGIAHTSEFGCGLHTWRYFARDLHQFWPIMIDSLGSLAPLTFDYQTADTPANRRTSSGKQLLSANAVWGWTFLADPMRATEFLYVTNASKRGLTLRGSGMTKIVTSNYFLPGQRVALDGAMENTAIADIRGRITFYVNLGPPHQYEQYSVPERVLEAAGSYWVSRSIRFSV